jgi:ADP-heptose:LPS heptosyltransferase
LPDRIERVAIFRALMLGDMLCAVPALRALRQALPRAQLTLVGLPWAADLAGRLSCIDAFVALPGYPGLPEAPCDVTQLPGFLAGMQARRFDLALQLHGSGGIVNPLVACFGATATAGFHDGHCWVPPADAARYTAWPAGGHEIERLLALTDHLGLPRQGLALEFPLAAHDRAAARELLAGHAPWGDRAGYAVVHPGAQLPSRRWPVERFTAVARGLAEQGLKVVLTGSPGEMPLTRAIAAQLEGFAPCLDLAGRTSLWTLGAVIEGARCLVSNDTGVSHIAAALGCPSVVVSSGADVARWAPLDHGRHRVLWHDLPCRPCAFATCPYDHACAHAVGVADVMAQIPNHGETIDG